MSYNRFDAFSSRSEDKSIVNTYCRMYSPVANPSDNTTIEFSIPPSSRNFVDLSKTRLKLTIEIKKADDGSAITKADTVAPVNNSLYSCIKSLEVSFNGTQMNQSEGPMCGYKSIVDTLLEKDEEYIKTQGVLCGFFKDTAFNLDDVDMTTAKNVGLRSRWFRCRDGGRYEVSGFLTNDVFHTDKYLPNGIAINLKLFLARPEFFLMVKGTTKYTYNISAAKLYITYLTPSSEMLTAYTKALSKKTAMFKYPRSDLTAYVIPSKQQTAEIDNIFSLGIPQQFFLMFTLNSAHAGQSSQNPFNFQHFFVNLVSVEFEGKKIGGFDLTPSFNADTKTSKTTTGTEVEVNYDHQFADAYLNLFYNKGNTSQGCLISPDEYRGGYFILRYDIPESVRYQKPLNDAPQGLTRISLKFDEALTAAVSVIVYTKFTDFYGIDRHHNVLLYPKNR